MLWLYLVVGFYTLYLSDCMHRLGQECILHWTCRDHHSKVIMIEEVFTASYNFVRGSNEQDVRRYRRDNRNNSQWLFDTTPVANQTTSKLFSESGSFFYRDCFWHFDFPYIHRETSANELHLCCNYLMLTAQ